AAWLQFASGPSQALLGCVPFIHVLTQTSIAAGPGIHTHIHTQTPHHTYTHTPHTHTPHTHLTDSFSHTHTHTTYRNTVRQAQFLLPLPGAKSIYTLFLFTYLLY